MPKTKTAELWDTFYVPRACRNISKVFRHGAARDIQNKLYIGYRIIFEAVSPAAFSVKYPAHLHIDILPEYQGQKVGTALMSALKEKLVSDNIKGVMLCVGKGNVRAIDFTKKRV